MSMLSESLSGQARYAELVKMLRPDYPFTQLGYHFGPAAGPTSRTMRVLRDGKHLIKKEYLGQLSGKTENEIGLLMAVVWKGLKHTASFKTVHAMTSHACDDVPTLELLMKNYGLDLEDWLFLMRQAKVFFIDSPYFYLALWHYVLSAMKELHEANFVQVDVKPDNICVALPALAANIYSSTRHQITLKFNLRELTLIDLGEALHPDPNKRVLLFHRNGMALGPGNTYISRHYKKQKLLVSVNDMKPLRSLDWRVDFYAFGCMVEEWNRETPFAPLPPAYLSPREKNTYTEAISLLHHLPLWLTAMDTDPCTEATHLPHDALIKKIALLVDLEKWSALEFSLPVTLTSDETSTATYLNTTSITENGSHSLPAHCTPAAETWQSLQPAPAASPTRQPVRPAAAANASIIELRKAGNELLPESINRRKIHRRALQNLSQATIEKNVNAMHWYRKTAQQSAKPVRDIDLLC